MEPPTGEPDEEKEMPSDTDNLSESADAAKAKEVEELKTGWRRFLETCARVKRERQGEQVVRIERPETAA